MPNKGKFLLKGLVIATIAMLAACNQVPTRKAPLILGPTYTPNNVKSAAHLPFDLQRIALLPCATDGPALSEEQLNRIDSALQAELIRSARAEVYAVSRDQFERYAGKSQLVSTKPLPFGLLPKLQKVSGSQAVLFVDLTSYSAYPPLEIGLRCKLVDFETGEVLWAFDNLFSAANPAVVNSARKHFLGTTRNANTPADMSETVLQNPHRFASYVSSATWATLPPREQPPPPAETSPTAETTPEPVKN